MEKLSLGDESAIEKIDINSIFTKILIFIKATKFNKCQLYFAIAFKYFRISMIVNAVQIYIITAFGPVPINEMMCRNCLKSLKNFSTCYLLYRQTLHNEGTAASVADGFARF